MIYKIRITGNNVEEKFERNNERLRLIRLIARKEDHIEAYYEGWDDYDLFDFIADEARFSNRKINESSTVTIDESQSFLFQLSSHGLVIIGDSVMMVEIEDEILSES